MSSVLSAIWKWIPYESKGAVFGKKLKEAFIRPFLREDYEVTYHSEEDWDSLVILDGCRFDMFQEENFLEGSLKRVNSAGSHTWEFMRKNFSGDHSDIVYVSANPQLGLIKGEFAEVYNVWEDRWDEELETVRPEDVTEVAKKAIEEHPEKRIVVHYMQPHYPFIGPKGKEIRGQGSYKFLGGRFRKNTLNIWEMLYKGDVSLEEVVPAYRENLRHVLHEVAKLKDFMTGKTVVTSDHGNLLGKKVKDFLPFRVYGHPIHFHDETLTSVPWLELPFSERKTTSKSGSTEISEEDSEKVRDRLEDLGYMG